MGLESNSNEKSVMIIGAGVAGMAAAQKLADHGINVHLIEKNDHLGGHASTLACMATDACQHCSSCLSYEMDDKLSGNTNLNIYLNSKVLKIENTKTKYKVRLTGKIDQDIEADKIIIATGFTPAVPQGLLGQSYGNNQRIITTVELNQIFKSNILYKYLPDINSPKIGFIQCVGSRNREMGKDYCSQVCCKISLRHIEKLIYLYPKAKISLFYIDLQIMGKEIRSKFDSLSKNVHLIQGVPFEIFSDENEKLSIIRENENTGNRLKDHFDMMVLSVGIKALGSTAGLVGMMDIPVNKWGFIDKSDMEAQKDIYVAGCASGPVDILTAKQQGISCAADILQSFNSKQKSLNQSNQSNHAVAIIGDGSHALKTALAVCHKGYNAWMFGFDKQKKIRTSNIHYIPDAKLISINGTIGAFTIVFKDSEQTRQKKFAAIIVAEPTTKTIAGKELNLSYEVLYSLKQFLSCVQNNCETIPGELVFWLDYSGPEDKVFSRTALINALELVKKGKQITFIMSNMLVHKLKGQHLYDKARKQGITFLRIDSQDDVNVQKENGKIVFKLKEKTLKNLTISFESDWLIISEKRIPGKNFPMIAGLLKDSLDTEGYLQSANVRHRLTKSPRKGIFYTGSCHDETDEQDQEMELEQILFSLHEIANKNAIDFSCPIEINSKKCKKCLVCFRTCPHGAVILRDGVNPFIVAEACFSCGLCMSSCPALAIESKDFSDTSYTSRVSKDEITVFACKRSGALSSKSFEHGSGISIQQVPCVCRISKNILLKTLEKGTKKIILASCHQDNCRSIKGTQKARVRTKQIANLTGIDPLSIIHYPVAANESIKFKTFLAMEFLAN